MFPTASLNLVPLDEILVAEKKKNFRTGNGFLLTDFLAERTKFCVVRIVSPLEN